MANDSTAGYGCRAVMTVGSTPATSGQSEYKLYDFGGAAFNTIFKGDPVSLNEKKLKPHELLSKLNKLGGEHGVGRIDIVENKRIEKIINKYGQKFVTRIFSSLEIKKGNLLSNISSI